MNINIYSKVLQRIATRPYFVDTFRNQSTGHFEVKKTISTQWY